MTKNPYKGIGPESEHPWNEGYAAGVAAGELRCLDALEKWVDGIYASDSEIRFFDIEDWIEKRKKDVSKRRPTRA